MFYIYTCYIYVFCFYVYIHTYIYIVYIYIYIYSHETNNYQSKALDGYSCTLSTKWISVLNANVLNSKDVLMQHGSQLGSSERIPTSENWQKTWSLSH